MPTTYHRLDFDVTSFIDDTIWSDQQRISALHALTGDTVHNLPPHPHVGNWYPGVMEALRNYHVPGSLWHFTVDMLDGVIDYESTRFGTPPPSTPRGAAAWFIGSPFDFKDFMVNSPLDINEYEQWLLNNDRDMYYWEEMANQTTRLREKEKKPQPFNPTPPKKLGRRNLKPVPLP